MQLTGTNRSIGLIALIFDVQRHSKMIETDQNRYLLPSLSFAGLVVLARSPNPIPSRTRPLNSSAPMVLWLKPWESRSLPGLQRTIKLFTISNIKNAALRNERGVFASGNLKQTEMRREAAIIQPRFIGNLAS